MTTSDLHSVKAPPDPEPVREPSLSLVLSVNYGPFRCKPVESDGDRDPGQRRISVHFGDVALFIERRDVGALVTALLTAATEVSGYEPEQEPPSGEPWLPIPGEPPGDDREPDNDREEE